MIDAEILGESDPLAPSSQRRKNVAGFTPKLDETRLRLIEAAGEIFAEVGYEAATVRQITNKAKANLSAVNYYFGDKRGLYQTILKSIGEDIYAQLKQRCSSGPAEDRLRCFVFTILTQESASRRPWAHLLMAREVLEQHSEQVEALVAGVSQVHKMAEEVVKSLVGARTSPARLKLAAGLLLSTCINQIFQQRLDKKIYPELADDPSAKDEALEQVYQFVHLGILGLTKTKKTFANVCEAAAEA